MASSSKVMWLKNEFLLRQERNPSYSLRSFARDLNISPAQLSNVFSGKRSITTNLLLKIADKLDLTPNEIQDLMTKEFITSRKKQDLKFVQLDEDRLDLIADWYHFAILSLADVKGARLESHWIARRLGITETEAREAIARLLRLKIIEKTSKGYKQIAPPIDSTHDIPSVAIRRQHRQILQKAANSLSNDPVEVREFGAVTMPVKLADLPKAKRMLREFRGKFAANFESATADRVYVMALQFFPIDNP